MPPTTKNESKRPFLRTKKRVSDDFSARKLTKTAISPHRNRKFKGKEGDRVIYARSQNYRSIFERIAETDTDFQTRIDALKSQYLEEVQRHSAAGFSDSGWTKNQKKNRVEQAILGKIPPNRFFSQELNDVAFADAFLEAISDGDFPARPAARARFLAESIAGYGEVSARRSRDISSEFRGKKISQPELWIKCHGKARWTVNGVCPECGESPSQSPDAGFLQG